MTADSSARFAPQPIPVIGIIGGIGSGKSSVARWASEHANLAVVDADRLGHLALENDRIKSALRQRFGDQIFDAAGEVQRSALARVVFGPSELQQAARGDLERIVHPEIESRIAEAITQAAAGHCQGVLLDAAVLLESGWQKRCDAVVFVDASDETRECRVAVRSNWSPEELQKREASQLSLREKRERSDAVISNNQDVSLAGRQLLDFLCRKWDIGCKPLPNASQQS